MKLARDFHSRPSKPGPWHRAGQFWEVWGIPRSQSQQDSSDLALPSPTGAITHHSRPTVAASPRSGSPWDTSPLWAGGPRAGTPIPSCPSPAPARSAPAAANCCLSLINLHLWLFLLSIIPASPSWRGEVPAAGGGRFFVPLQRSSWIPQNPHPDGAELPGCCHVQGHPCPSVDPQILTLGLGAEHPG